MNSLMQFWQSWGGWAIAALLTLLSAGFLLRFVIPALRLGRELAQANERLATLAEAPEPATVDPKAIGESVMSSPLLRHLWREYAQTLHPMAIPRGTETPPRWRATTMAEQFFTEQALVDTPLKTEFYKHLPGILTGIGILGTFSGLIAGLEHFEVSSDAETVRAGLRGLIQGVGHAFQVSAAAIALAMLFTWIEKSLLTLRYRQVERLVQLIDGLFDAGVGEEYLARLVRASEVSAVQGQQLRQALTVELRQSMEALLLQQQEAALAQQQALATQVAEAVAKTVGLTLAEPLARMSAAVEKLGSGQGVAMGGAIEQALAKFNSRLDETFGQKHGQLETLLAKTAQAMEGAASELARVAGRLEQAGRTSVDSAASRLDGAGQNVGRAGEAFSRSAGDIGRAAEAMSAAAKVASDSMDEQRRSREAITEMVADLRATVEAARRDASLTSALVGRLESAATTLGEAERRAEHYLQGVNEVLGQAHQAFADNIERTLTQGNSQFQRQVVGAVEALQGAIEELGDALATTEARR